MDTGTSSATWIRESGVGMQLSAEQIKTLHAQMKNMDAGAVDIFMREDGRAKVYLWETDERAKTLWVFKIDPSGQIG